MSCAPIRQNAKTPGIWNPLPYFDTVQSDGQLNNIQSVENFYAAAARAVPLYSALEPNSRSNSTSSANVSGTRNLRM